MWLKHDSRDIFYRTPYGAVTEGTKVTLRLDVWDEEPQEVAIISWIEGQPEKRTACKRKEAGDHLTFEGTFSTRVLGPAWYVFEVKDSSGTVYYYGPREGCTGGSGMTYPNLGPSYQITVYHNRKERPTWYEKAIVYQIFPDRFYRGSDWKKRVKKSMDIKRKAGTRVLVKNWDTPAEYVRDENGIIQYWQFWGGTLKGIEEKLDYIKDMGFSAIYLNPIFEAFSNHRYDTADYLKIDPMLGDNESFKELCEAAKERGISIILDGVFNHAGADSRYFNRFGTYPMPGAWQGPRSKYRKWFLLNDDGSYESWWGIGDLPAWNKNNADYQRFIYGPNGVIEHWLRLGARGWRLDVADELTDSFIQGIKSAEDRVNANDVLLGEVWEDASHKVAYGEMRKYLCGYELDSVMNYPFREALLNFLRGDWPAEGLAERMASLKENYPPHAFYECLNLLSSHDRERLITYLMGPRKEELTDEERKNYRLPQEAMTEAHAKVWQAVLVQMLTPGVPSVYYGDEVGMQGYTDPYNRGPYPWNGVDEAVRTSYHTAIQLRRMFPVAQDGDFEPFFYGEDVYGFWRLPAAKQRKGYDASVPKNRYPEEALCVLVNRSPYEEKEVRIPRRGQTADELLLSCSFSIEDDECVVKLPKLGSAVIYFHKLPTLSKRLNPGAGVVAHITSLPAENGGPGTFGPPAYDFIDFLKRTGNTYWQVLPLHPTDSFNSPYAGLSALAGNTDLIFKQGRTLDQLFSLWERDALADVLSGELTNSNPLSRVWKKATRKNYEAFVKKNHEWLAPYATFMSIRDSRILSARRQLAKLTPGKRKHFKSPKSIVWQEWPKKFKTYSEDLHKSKKLQRRIDYYKFGQFIFQLQWDALKEYAHKCDIQVIGDIPMYVSEDSVDTWAHPNNFQLDEKGYKTEEAAVPPDAFAPKGQLWGNPTYDWNYLEQDNYAWWMQRLRREFNLYDWVRLDHFVGFQNYYQVPAGKKATEGLWLLGPGVGIFQQAFKEFGPLPLIAEDLGTITPSVRGLLSQCGFVGMDVAEFYNGDLRTWYDSVFNKISYTSTHDTDTLVGWAKTTYDLQFKDEPEEVADDILNRVLQSAAEVVMVPLQDVLGLGSSARMNKPGTSAGNWRWQASADQIQAAEKPYAEKILNTHRGTVQESAPKKKTGARKKVSAKKSPAGKTSAAKKSAAGKKSTARKTSAAKKKS